MNLKQYVQDAIRTESKVEIINTDIVTLLNIMRAFVAAGNLLDDVKKNTFYGKEINQQKWDKNEQELRDACHYRLYPPNQSETVNEYLNIDSRLFHAIIGIATESTELIEAIIKALENDTDIDHVNVREELGDLNWYQAIAIDSTNADWNNILDTNIAKLKKRYPEKFTAEAAINRNLHAERKILEGERYDGEKS